MLNLKRGAISRYMLPYPHLRPFHLLRLNRVNSNRDPATHVTAIRRQNMFAIARKTDAGKPCVSEPTELRGTFRSCDAQNPDFGTDRGERLAIMRKHKPSRVRPVLLPLATIRLWPFEFTKLCARLQIPGGQHIIFNHGHAVRCSMDREHA